MPLLVSACLLGCPCRYDGGSNFQPWAEALGQRYTIIPICPEQLGGLPTPRLPAERLGAQVVSADGGDVTAAFQQGAAEVLHLARRLDCMAAVLKERSPSCGCGVIYDGTFTHTRRAGDGVTAELLRQNGIRVYGESEIERLMEELPEYT